MRRTARLHLLPWLIVNCAVLLLTPYGQGQLHLSLLWRRILYSGRSGEDFKGTALLGCLQKSDVQCVYVSEADDGLGM